jgi:hypothetical protein
VSTFKELVGRKSSGSGLENRESVVEIRRADHETPLYPQKLALISLTSGGRSVGIVRSRTEAMEFDCFNGSLGKAVGRCGVLLNIPVCIPFSTRNARFRSAKLANRAYIEHRHKTLQVP